MTLHILVIDDELGRLDYKRAEFIQRWDLSPQAQFAKEVAFEFITSQHHQTDRIVNDSALAVAHVAHNPERWALVLLDMQFDHGTLLGGEPVSSDPQFGLTIQAELEREFPALPIVQFTAQTQSNLRRQDGVYLSKLGSTPDDLRLLLVAHGRASMRAKAQLLQVPADTVVASATMVALYAQVYRLARSNIVTPILIRGESGTGKEHLARYIHSVSGRSDQFLPVQVSGYSANLLESELFGHEKGAFTDASAQHSGAFSRAGKGTLFLDELGALSPELQAKLLRVVGERTFSRMKGTVALPVECAIVAATADNLEANGSRKDLIARFNVVTIPPLRERPEELLNLAEHFLAQMQKQVGKSGLTLSSAARAALLQANFPENARQVEKAVMQAVVSVSNHGLIQPAHLGLPVLASAVVNAPPAASTLPVVAPVSAAVQAVPLPTPHAQQVPIQEALSHAAVQAPKPTLESVIAQLSLVSVPTTPDGLRGALAALDAALSQVHKQLAIAALQACRHQVSGKIKVGPAVQLLTSEAKLTTTNAARKLNSLLGLKQDVTLSAADLLALCEGQPLEALPGVLAAAETSQNKPQTG